MEAGNITEEYFTGLFENKLSKISFISGSFILDIFNIVLGYGVIWYDRFGLDIKQNLMNMLFTSLCLAAIINIPIIQLFEIPRFFFGPKPAAFCLFQLVLKNAFKLQIFLLLDASILTRYIYIFWLKNPSAVNEGFWNVFINIWIGGASLISSGVLNFRLDKVRLGKVR